MKSRLNLRKRLLSYRDRGYLVLRKQNTRSRFDSGTISNLNVSFIFCNRVHVECDDIKVKGDLPFSKYYMISSE